MANLRSCCPIREARKAGRRAVVIRGCWNSPPGSTGTPPTGLTAVLQAPGRVRAKVGDGEEVTITAEAEETITLIPMGAARLRVSSFPVIRSAGFAK